MEPFDPESQELPEAPGFRVIAAVGAGSRGNVYRARDLREAGFALRLGARRLTMAQPASSSTGSPMILRRLLRSQSRRLGIEDRNALRMSL